ncbi:hypothetical protein FOMPIDRAFT_1053092 [Fomitopsis schrenkii]|uniref:Uncharacterized protein n=1 Tax=Fomitopsis schrenkii TaxID=2126942 RepID=S8FDP5_FOMSC|nr:hypothetical protein FOMPIDRAFT_1053092 [Fomitopsis schrenkii]
MRKASASIWRRSLEQLDDLPPCPSELIEPAYISLVFSPLCTACGKGRANTVYWIWLSRFCVECRNSSIIPCNEVDQFLTEKQWKVFDTFAAEEDEEDKYFLQTRVTGQRHLCYLKSDIHKAVEVYEKARYGNGQQWFRDQRRALVKERKRFAAACLKWAHKVEQSKKAEREQILDERIDEIGTRLRTLGWDREVDYLQEQHFRPLKAIKSIWVSKTLTDRAWTDMSIEVVARMEDVRAQRLEHEAMALMPQRWAALEDAGHELLERQFAKQPELLAYGLNIADLALQDEFRALLCSPPDVPVDGAAFLALDGQMDVIVERWTGHVREALRELVVQAKAVTKRSKGIDPLDLAMMVFGPKDNAVAGDWCRFFPSVANERVLRTAGAELGRAVSPYEEFIYAKSPGPFCDTAGTRLCGPQPTSFVRRVIRMAGLRGDTATAAEMDALDLRWLDHDGFVYTWRELISYYHCYGEPKGWRSARVEELVQARQRGIERLQNGHDRVWTCIRCNEAQARGPMTWVDVTEHLFAEHGIAREDVDDADISLSKILIPDMAGVIRLPVLT